MAKMQANKNGVIITFKEIQVNVNGIIQNLKKVQAIDNGVIRTIFEKEIEFTKLPDPTGGLPAGQGYGVSFSADNKFLAVAHHTTPFVTIYKIE